MAYKRNAGNINTKTGRQVSQTTPNRVGGRVAAGNIVISNRWKGSDLVKALQGQVRVTMEEDLGVVDFYPSAEVGVVYIPEGEIVAGPTYRRKLCKLRKAEGVRGIVLAEKTKTSSQYFAGVQKLAVLDLGLVLLPVNSQSEAASLLAQLVHIESRPTSNEFRKKRKQPPADASVLATVQTIPGLGEFKAKSLLQKFKSIEGISRASEEELVATIGRSGVQVRQFFWGPGG